MMKRAETVAALTEAKEKTRVKGKVKKDIE